MLRGTMFGVYAQTERAGLCEFLDMQRAALIAKLQGVSADRELDVAPELGQALSNLGGR